jgi:hypothetical protein
MQLIYSLSIIPGYDEYIESGIIDKKYTKYYNDYKFITKEYQTYHIIQYNKEYLTIDLIDIFGLLRSAIFYKKQLINFSMPKFQPAELFILKNPVLDKIEIEVTELIEGLRLYIFYNKEYGINGGWEIATQNNIGGNIYVNNEKTVKEIFMETCKLNNLNLNILNPDYCYNFILQHPSYSLKLTIKNPQLYLIETFYIKMNKYIYKLCIKEIIERNEWKDTNIKIPKQIEKKDYTKLIKDYGSGNTDYNILGVVLFNSFTGKRAKIINPNYVHNGIKNNDDNKDLYQYLLLRNKGKIDEYLVNNSNKKSTYSVYRDIIHIFTKTLYNNYIDCFVKKIKHIDQYSEQYRCHMKKLHNRYIKILLPNKGYINEIYVKDYINKLEPKKLLFYILFIYRQKRVDIIKQQKV